MDLDADGRNDVISGSWPGEIHWFRRRPNGTYAPAETLRTASGAVNVGKASSVAVADWDGDRDLDLVVGTIEGSVFLVPNVGSPTKPLFGGGAAVTAAGKVIRVDSDAGPAVADWDGDGRADLLVGAGAGGVTWFRNTGVAGRPELAAGVPLLGDAAMQVDGEPKRSAGRSKPAVADWNGDGLPDLIVGDFRISPGSTEGSTTHGGVWVYLRTAKP